jgi:hypothetical protein
MSAPTASPEGGPTGVWTTQKHLPETSLRETWKPDRLIEKLRLAELALAERLEQIGGCGDGNCKVHRRGGQHTNGGCRCLNNRSDPIKAERVVAGFQTFRREVAEALAILSPAPPVEAGWKLVPVEPTEAMIEAYCTAHHDLGFHAWANLSHIWPRVLASVAPPVVGGGEGDQGASCTDIARTGPVARPETGAAEVGEEP